jgi:plastocyanin
LRPAALCTLALGVFLGHAASGHDTGFAELQSPPLAPGQAYTALFDLPGTYAYHCHPHPSMTGQLRVLAGPGPGGPASHRVSIVDDGNATHAGRMAFRDEASGANLTTLHAGDTVVWTNEGGLRHDVHVVALAPAGSDDGSFETTVGGLLAITLATLVASGRRT